MANDTITTTRNALVAAFEQWDRQARAERWPDTPDAEASADHLLHLLRDQNR